jgi:glucokinase
MLDNPPNFSWEIVPLVDLMKQYFDVPIVITNDANAAAIGEMKFGSARGKKDFIVITLGTGLGSGIVVDGKLVFGHNGVAGEMGHINASPDSNRKCGCGKRGCLETYASATGIVITVKELLKNLDYKSDLRLIPKDELTSKDIAEAAGQGDKIALEAFDITGKMLGIRLADAVSLLAPETIYFSGGLAKAKDLLLKPVDKYMEQYMFPNFKRSVTLELSGLMDKNSAILGAAALIQSNLDM